MTAAVPVSLNMLQFIQSLHSFFVCSLLFLRPAPEGFIPIDRIETTHQLYSCTVAHTYVLAMYHTASAQHPPPQSPNHQPPPHRVSYDLSLPLILRMVFSSPNIDSFRLHTSSGNGFVSRYMLVYLHPTTVVTNCYIVGLS